MGPYDSPYPMNPRTYKAQSSICWYSGKNEFEFEHLDISNEIYELKVKYYCSKVLKSLYHINFKKIKFEFVKIKIQLIPYNKILYIPSTQRFLLINRSRSSLFLTFDEYYYCSVHSSRLRSDYPGGGPDERDGRDRRRRLRKQLAPRCGCGEGGRVRGPRERGQPRGHTAFGRPAV